MGGTFEDYKWSHICDSVAVKHESSVKFLVMVRADNRGEIFISSNIAAPSYTKHVDIKYKYVDEYDMVKTVFAENDSYILMLIAY